MLSRWPGPPVPLSATGREFVWLLAAGLGLLSGCAPAARVAAGNSAAAVSPAPIQVRDVAEGLGLDFRWPKHPSPLTILDAFGCGCAFLDYDGDGWQDVLLVSDPHPRLYRNLRGERFQDVTEVTGLHRLRGAWKGCAVADYDGDGRPDLLLTGYRCLALLRNEAGGRWSDATSQSGLSAGERWSASAGFMDLDADGRLDLVLLNYLRYGSGDRQYCEPRPGVRAGCAPHYYRSQYPELWQNLGGGRLRNVSAVSGMTETSGTSQVLAFADVDEDGDQDFYIGNDGKPADLMMNEGELRFRNAGVESGAAYGINANALAAMSADFADYDRDGHLDLFVTAFSGEASSLLRGEPGGFFQHTGLQQGLVEATLDPLGFGAAWADLDNDGWPDLAVANGHVYDRASELYPGTAFLEPLQLLRNEAGRGFRDLVPEFGGDAAVPRLGRGLAAGDFDNDGRLDLLVVDYAAGPVLLHNTSPDSGHWLTLDLRDSRPAGGNRFAYGARIEGRAGERRWVAQVSPASSYLSSRDPRVHLGLGDVPRLDSLTIRWPDGTRQVLKDVAADRILRIDAAGRKETLRSSSRPDQGA